MSPGIGVPMETHVGVTTLRLLPVEIHTLQCFDLGQGIIDGAHVVFEIAGEHLLEPVSCHKTFKSEESRIGKDHTLGRGRNASAALDVNVEERIDKGDTTLLNLAVGRGHPCAMCVISNGMIQ